MEFSLPGVLLYVALKQLVQGPIEIRAQADSGFGKLKGTIVGRQNLRQQVLDGWSRFERQGGFEFIAHGANPVLNVLDILLYLLLLLSLFP